MLSQLIRFNGDTALGILEGLIEVHSLILHFNKLILVNLNSKLNLDVLLELLSAVNLVEN